MMDQHTQTAELQTDRHTHTHRTDSITSTADVGGNKTIPLIGDKGDKFFRKGVVGDWKNDFTQEQNGIIDRLIEEKLTPIGLSFDYE